MKMLNINKKIYGKDISVNISSRLNLFFSESGTGKTFFMNIIYGYCLDEGIKCAYINHKSSMYRTEDIINICKDMDIVMLDNADLYLNNDILNSICDNTMIFVDMKNTTKIDIEDYDRVRIVYDGDSMEVYNEL